MSNPLIHIFYTGGTIGMIWDSDKDKWVLDPEFATKLRHRYLQGRDVPDWDIVVRDRPLDSSNMSPEDWLSIAKYIQDKERADPRKYTGYVVLHGTDTMAYTVSALTFMIEELTKPIIFTGSQVPMSEEGNDAIHNVVQSLKFAASDRTTRRVYLYFFDRLMLGCRTVKIHAYDRNGFDTPNLDAVATVVDEEMVFSENISGLSEVKAANSFTIQEFTETQVGVLRLFPGLSQPIAENFLEMCGLKGAILHAYGAGNGPSSLGCVFKEAAKTKILVACTQCLRGGVDFVYGTGLGQYGVVSGHDMTLEAATTKLFWLLSKYPNEPARIKSEMERNIKGELTRRGPAMRVLVHLQSIGDQVFRDNEFAGTRGESRRLEGFELRLNPAIPGLSLRYMAHLQNTGDVPFVNEGQFIGTRGLSRPLEGFAIQLTGAEAANYNVFYMAHLQNVGDTPMLSNGQFCGTRGLSRRVEGILVRIEPK